MRTEIVKCSSTDHLGYPSPTGDNPNCLEVGKAYTLIGIDIRPYESVFVLKEFPDKEFNSVNFDHDPLLITYGFLQKLYTNRFEVGF